MKMPGKNEFYKKNTFEALKKLLNDEKANIVNISNFIYF